MFLIAGERSINLATPSIQCVRSITRFVSSGSGFAKVLANVNEMKETAAELRRSEMRLLADIAKYEADGVKTVLSIEQYVFNYRAVQGLDIIKRLLISQGSY